MEKIKTILIDVLAEEQIISYEDVEAAEPTIEPSPEQKINGLKQALADTDYQAIKFAEGWISDEDYAPIKAERQAIREEINRLEEVI
jgi:hypothetical protein